MSACEWMLEQAAPELCGAPSRFTIEREPAAPGYPSFDSCALHLGAMVPLVTASPDGARAIVTTHWEDWEKAR